MAIIPVRAKDFAWVDTETTHLDPTVGEILEIAIVRVTPSGEESSFHAKIRMEHPENAHPKALEVNGYTESAWATAKSALEVFRQISEDGWFDNAIVAGHNVSFDVRFIHEVSRRVGVNLKLDYHTYDTVTLALEHLKPYVDSVSLVNVCRALGIPTDNAHSAMADCRMAMAVHNKLTSVGRFDWAEVVRRNLNPVI